MRGVGRSQQFSIWEKKINKDEKKRRERGRGGKEGGCCERRVMGGVEVRREGEEDLRLIIQRSRSVATSAEVKRGLPLKVAVNSVILVRGR